MTKPTQWPCRGCGAPLSGRGGKRYCGPDCRPRCSVEDCERPVHTNDMCSAHATRAARYGDPLAPKVRGRNEGACSVDGCDKPMRKVGLCASHYSRTRPRSTSVKRKRPNISTTPLRVWAELHQPCVVCGEIVQPGSGRRKHCSGACQAADSHHKGQRPTEAICGFCRKPFSLQSRAGGRLQRADTIWCPDCGRDSPHVKRFKQYGVTREQYEAATAKGCAICGGKDRPLHVDHDHACCPADKRCCGKCVRGFICGPCNRGLGLFFDDVTALERAALYLKRQLN